MVCRCMHPMNLMLQKLKDQKIRCKCNYFINNHLRYWYNTTNNTIQPNKQYKSINNAIQHNKQYKSTNNIIQHRKQYNTTNNTIQQTIQYNTTNTIRIQYNTNTTNTIKIQYKHKTNQQNKSTEVESVTRIRTRGATAQADVKVLGGKKRSSSGI